MIHWGEICNADQPQAKAAPLITSDRDEAEMGGLIVPKMEHKFSCSHLHLENVSAEMKTLKITQKLEKRSKSLPGMLNGFNAAAVWNQCAKKTARNSCDTK